MTLPIQSPCALCATLYKGSCCNAHRGAALIFIAPHEVGPIEAATGVRLTTRVPTPQERIMLAKFHLPTNSVPALPTNGRGDCVFLGDQGCTIPSVKPYICRIYPFVNMSKTWRIVQPQGGCRAYDEAEGNLTEALLQFNIDEAWLNAQQKAWHDAIEANRP